MRRRSSPSRVIVLIPLGAPALQGVDARVSAAQSTSRLDPRVLASLRVTFGTSLAAALIDVVFGLGVPAWTLTRYSFPGRRLFDAMVDLPFALPTAVAGIRPRPALGRTVGSARSLATAGVVVAYTRFGRADCPGLRWSALRRAHGPADYRRTRTGAGGSLRKPRRGPLADLPARRASRARFPRSSPALPSLSPAPSASTAPSSLSPAISRWSPKSRPC